MAELSKDEAQALVNDDAPLLRFVHNTIYQRAEAGDDWAKLLLPMVDKLHGDAAALIVFGNLAVPPDGLGGVHTDSGGGGK